MRYLLGQQLQRIGSARKLEFLGGDRSPENGEKL
jgi:hypothetical protein